MAIAMALLCVVASACGGQESQDEGERARSYKLAITDAFFPDSQRISERQRLRITVRNEDERTVPIVAVTVATVPGKEGGAPQAFSNDIADPAAASPSRPIWVIDEAPTGATTAVTNTWTLGPLRPGQSHEFEWDLTPVQTGSFTIDYSVAPSITGKARVAAGSDTEGQFRVEIDSTPPQSRVEPDGTVVDDN